MKSLLASVRASVSTDGVDLAVQQLEDEWRRHGSAQLDRHWAEHRALLAANEVDSVLLLSELIKTDLRCRFARGQTPTAASYLDQFPALHASDSRVLSLIYEEYCLAEERGDAVDVESFYERYAPWKDSLASQLQYHRLFSQAAGPAPPPPRFPVPGEMFDVFRLVSLLGKGGTSRVFVARDLSLGGKRVVLKVSLDRGQEPEAQGALDHPRIVPVNSLDYDEKKKGLRGLSMPYRPGLPLDEVIKRVAPGSRPRGALALWNVLIDGVASVPDDEGEGPSSEGPGVAAAADSLPRGDGWDGFPARGSYARGVAWIGLAIAHALAYAHGKRTFHRDVKPGNVLLTLHHGPQLLDFNLAESPHTTAHAEAAIHGGTLPYMAPEQIEAFLDPQLWGKVGPRADIYSLGLVLRELLTGQAPDLPAQTLSPPRAMRVMLDRRPLLDVSARRSNPTVPHALSAIVARCLAIAADDRYEDADALVEDLERFLHRRPLVHAVNPSRLERLGNQVVRRKKPLALAFVGALVFGTAAMVFSPRSRAPSLPAPPPIQSSLAFQNVVQSLEAGRVNECARSLDQLEPAYASSWQFQVYRCLIWEFRDQAHRSTALFRELVQSPGARAEIVSWGREHPGFARHWRLFADRLLRDGRSRINKGLAAGLKDGPNRLELLALASEALGITHEIVPIAPKTLHSLAMADEARGDFASAHLRIAQAIDLYQAELACVNWGMRRLGTSLNVALEWWDIVDWMVLRKIWERSGRLERGGLDFDCHWLRCRIAYHRAEQLRGTGGVPSTRRAVGYLREAESDLAHCDTILADNPKCPANVLMFYLGLKANVLLFLGEIEIDLGNRNKPRGHLDSAEAAIAEFCKQIEATGDRDHDFVKNWKSRLHVARERLRTLAVAAGPRIPLSGPATK